jgi:hypothetical protein
VYVEHLNIEFIIFHIGISLLLNGCF